jgi:hypothetical protein
MILTISLIAKTAASLCLVSNAIRNAVAQPFYSASIKADSSVAALLYYNNNYNSGTFTDRLSENVASISFYPIRPWLLFLLIGVANDN